MTMQFQAVKAAIISTLGAAEAGRFRTIGYQSQTQSADQIEGALRSVRVYYGSGSFPKNAGSLSGPNQHDITFNIELAVAEPSKADLTVLNDPIATPIALAAALLAAKQADEEADTSWDNLADIVYQILMDARNLEFGLTNEVANRWAASIQKDTIGKVGAMVTVTGVIQLTLRVEEIILGDDSNVPLDVIESSLGIEDQDPVAGNTTTYT